MFQQHFDTSKQQNIERERKTESTITAVIIPRYLKSNYADVIDKTLHERFKREREREIEKKKLEI